MTTTTAPCHQSDLTHPLPQRHPWTSEHSVVGKRRTPQQTTIPFTRRTSQGMYTGPLPWMKSFIRKVNQDENTCCPAHHHRHFPARWNGSRWWESPFQKEGKCRSMSANPADRNSPQRTSQVRQLRTETLKVLKLIYETIKLKISLI